ncbi:[NiFe] hydrogenase maturation protease HydD [Campylobacter gracilis]|uniref:Hydrogenase maturation protease n=1 Tax=Campylobacter gracilis RM3268 TaxID=553220 RepID=C8PG96_9BACT|nr:[NiFe] hydrogenase maturation protease HydD [Campylobacter gracilis]EEV18134.1 hydrogenase maturation protease [Campylobacter gracilis RM3268]SUW82126.1 hydrogenase maturation protease HydD [Campylobacter gracilis]
MRVLVLGIGNVIYADEGIGVHFVRALAQNYKFYPKAAARNSMASEDFAAQNFMQNSAQVSAIQNSTSQNSIERNSLQNFADENSIFKQNFATANLDRNSTSENSAKQNFASNSTSQNSAINSAAQSSINANLVAKNLAVPSDSADQISFIDGGTLASFLMPTMAEFDEILLVDCINADGAKGGEVYFFDYNAMPKQISWSGSAHEVEMLQTLQMMDLCGDLPHVKILAVVPQRIEEASFKLSSVILESSKIMEKTALKYLSDLGFAHEKIADLSAQDIADRFAKRGRDDSSI